MMRRPVAALIAALLALTACQSAPPDPTATAQPPPTETLTPLEPLASPFPTRDPALGRPTLPPTFTPTPTLTPSATGTPTATPSATPTLAPADFCEALVFPAESVDGLTFGTSGNSQFIVGLNAPAIMTWVLTGEDSGISEVLSFNQGEAVLVNPSTLAAPGRYTWTVYVTTADFPRLCETTVSFRIVSDVTPSATPPLVERLFERWLDSLTRATPTPTSPAPTATSSSRFVPTLAP